MNSIINQTLNLIFFISLTITYSLKAHDSFNGGCDHHCEKSDKSFIREKTSKNNNFKKQIEENYSCLKKSLCRG